VRDAADAKGIALRLTVQRAVPEAAVVIDTLRFEQVLLNLLSNAVKFTDIGEVQVTVDAVDCHLIVEVRDSGLGMSDEQISRLYTSFEQADRSTTRRYGGTGLGLAITKRLVELMRGTVSVTSRLGEGSVFTVRLPLKLVDCDRGDHGHAPKAATALPTSEADRRPSPQRLAGLRVLVAEDEPVNQIVIQSLLAAEGARVDIASDGYQAIDRVSVSRVPAYDVVLLDVMMPGIDGYETARRIRVIAPTLPIIGQTAHAGAEDLALCFQAGMVDRIVKPLIADDIVRAILDCLANHEGRALSLN
jgi:CheY-like chemotaxis protein/anti-sigma regulatory factor (Ser/Thr protein kinase)